MYNALLDRVINIIKTTDKITEPKEEDFSDFYNRLFSPELHKEEMARRRKKENLKNSLIIGATSLAVIGEIGHLIKRSGIINKIIKK